MLADQEMPNLAPSPTNEGDNVFEEVTAVCSTPLTPRSGHMPGIILTTEGDASPESINTVGRHDSRNSRSKTRSTRRKMQAQVQHRSPSGSRMAVQNGGHNLYLSSSGVSRSQSMRTARRPQSVDPTHRFRHRIASIPNDMTLPSDGLSGQRLASNQSLPLPGDESDFMRLRNFAVTSKGVVNRGDSFRSKSRSSHSVASVGVSGSSGQLPVVSGQPKDDLSINYPSTSYCTPRDEASAEVADTAIAGPSSTSVVVQRPCRYKVLVVGAPDVGKTALTNQFMTSEYKCAYDISQDEENEKFVGVILNGSESELVFSEHQFTSDSTENFTEMHNPDAYLVVYSVTSKRSLQLAKEILRLIQKWDTVESKAVILVGNKTDLARHRVLSTDDGRSLAIEESSKFIETSAGINHHVDELLVGILSQIRLKQSSMEKILRKRESVSLGSAAGGAKLRGGKCPGCAGCKAKGILKRILKKACSRSKSCDNLHVL
ncbi:GTP-binding protein RAD like protein [Argiope bruennichi]|uniref:GTP-binding protein RAD like protein n=1 Tax=Argiope bruennichi TaxID=94029 RepID=A0A8T0FAJ6_ARGBR|nr:GTP-binding protein RAD like protein [Argiope bruennichi]